MNIKRDLFEIISKKILNENKIIILYGARQVGKTTLINSILENLNLKILKVSGDEIQFFDILSSRDSNKLKLLTDGYDLIFIDEAQRIPDIGLNLKIMHDKFPDLKIVATGSSSFELANRIKEPLTGRTWTYHLHPISINELKSIYTPIEIFQRINEFLVFGLYPEQLKYQNMNDKIAHLKELSSSYLYKDILELSSIRHSDKLIGLLRLLAFQIGSEVSYHELSKSLGIARETITSYIDLLEKSFIIFRLQSFSKNLRKEITKMQKIYFWDLGIRNIIINQMNFIDNRDDVGKLWENFLVSERVKWNSNRIFFTNQYFWRVYSGAEVDYIEEKDGKLSGFEFKYKAKKIKAPQTWIETYPDSSFEQINKDNFFTFVS